MRSTSSKLNARDLILIAILTTVMVVIEIIVGVILMPVLWLALLLAPGIAAALMAPVYMLMLFKVAKRGTFFMVMMLRGLFYTLMGWPTMLLILLPAALLGELLLSSAKKYQDFRRVSAVWIITSAIYSLHGAILVWVFGIQYLADSGQFAPEHIDLMESAYLNPMAIVSIMLLGACGAALGTWLGKKMLNKHFIKAGLVRGYSA